MKNLINWTLKTLLKQKNHLLEEVSFKKICEKLVRPDTFFPGISINN